MKELEIGSDHTIVDWKQFCWNVCVEYFLNNPEQIEGRQRSTMQVHHARQQWVFGGYDPQEKKWYLAIVRTFLSNNSTINQDFHNRLIR